MLKNIDPLLNADVLSALRAMGHGNVVVLSDTNFPSDAVARETTYSKLLRIDASAARVVQAVLSVMPLDSFIDDPAKRMEVVDMPKDHVPPVQAEVQEVVSKLAEKDVNPELVGVDRFDFYDASKQSYCVIATNERRFFGCFMFTKGVLPPDEA